MVINKVMRNERGQSRLTDILLAVFVLAVAIGIWKFAIPLGKHMIFANKVGKLVNYDRENKALNPTMIRSMYNYVNNYAKGLHLPVQEKDIKADWEGDKAIIIVNYVHVVDLWVWKYNWRFNVYKKSEGVGFQ